MKQDYFIVYANGRTVLCETLKEAQAKVKVLKQFGMESKIYYPFPTIQITGQIGTA